MRGHDGMWPVYEMLAALGFHRRIGEARDAFRTRGKGRQPCPSVHAITPGDINFVYTPWRADLFRKFTPVLPLLVVREARARALFNCACGPIYPFPPAIPCYYGFVRNTKSEKSAELAVEATRNVYRFIEMSRNEGDSTVRNNFELNVKKKKRRKN